MAYSFPNQAVELERNVLGGVAQEPGTLTITSPVSIDGSSVYVTWSTEGILADTFRITLGTTKVDAQIADTGDIPAGNGTKHFYPFAGLSYTTEFAYLTIRYKYGSGPYQGVQRYLPINIELPEVDDDPDKNWDDAGVWDDSDTWDE